MEIKDDGAPGNITEANETACRLLGYSKEDLHSKTLEDLDDLEDMDMKRRCMHELMTTGACFFETNVLKKNGAKMPVEVNSHVVNCLLPF